MIQKILRQLLLMLLTVGLAQAAWAQGTTTSSIAGTVTDQKGEQLPGATVIAVHTPTGTQYVAPTNSDGRFYLQNMRVGGPYTVKVTFVGYQDFNRSNVILTVGQTQRIDVKLGDGSTQLDAVTVVGSNPRSVLNAERSGPVTNIGTEQIQRLPTIQRSLNDFLRLTPQGAPSNGGFAVGGGNYRQNNITVDGSDFNNNFGIGGNLPAGGSPISLDAIEEITVNLTPFDVRQSGFVGGAVNAITRSGSNNVQGSLYGFYRNQQYYGTQVGAENLLINNISVKTYGGRVGGPIIKDKLFFFINAERSTEDVPGQQNVASTAGAPYGSGSNVTRPNADTLTKYSNYLQSRYGYATGPFQGYNFQNENTRFLGRLDWNISSKHHLTLRYNQVNAKSPSFVSTSRSPYTTNFAFGTTARTSILALPFANSNYFNENNFYSAALELNSTFGRYFNTLRATYTKQNDPRSSNSSVFPFVDILDGTSTRNAAGVYTALGNPVTSFGYELFSLGNLRDVETYSFVDFASATFGKHTLTLGGQFDLQNTRNGFQRFANSYYVFNTWEDFRQGRNPLDYAITYSLLPNYEQAFPRFKTAQYSAYLQDEFAPSEHFRLTVGLRAELNSYLDVREIQTNRSVLALSFTDGRKIDTGLLPTNRVLLSPRIGFNWDLKGDRTLQLRGGSGIFTGKVPTVWVVAQSGDSGMLQVTQLYSQLNGGALPRTNLPFNPDPNAYRPAQVEAGSFIPTAGVSGTDPSFRNPQTWKSSLALDARLPFGFVGTLEAIYNRDLITAYGQNYNLVNPTRLNINGQGAGAYADNRDIYPNATAQKYTNPLTAAGQYSPTGTTPFNAIMLSNGHKGYNWSVTGKLEKQFASGFQAMLAYTRSDARVMFDGSGDQLLNTWSLTQVVNNPNDPQLSYANYIVPDRVVGALTYRKEYLKHLGTTISLFYSGSIQGRFSYVYGGDFNRDGVSANDLIYIPRNASEITFSPFNFGTATAPNTLTAQQQSDLFFQYVDQDPYLSQHKGEYAERNGATLPWRNQVDFRFAQDVFVAAKTRNTLQFTLDILNFGNLLNRNWGLTQTVNNSSILVPTNQANLVAGGSVLPTFRLAADRGAPITSTFRNNIVTTSTYYMQVGLRYSFN